MTIAEWKPLNKEQTEALFNDHAVLMGRQNAVPVHIAAQIISPECVEYALSGNHGGEYWNAAGLNSLIPDGMVHWLTHAGFMAAVSAANALYYWPEQLPAYMERKAERDRIDAEEDAKREEKRKAARERHKARESAKEDTTC